MTPDLGMLMAYAYFRAVLYHWAVSECLIESRLMKKLFIEDVGRVMGTKRDVDILGN